MKTKLLALAVGLSALAIATGASAYTGGAGLAGSPHDFSSAVAPSGTSGGQAILQWLNGTTVITTYTPGGTNTPNCVAQGTANAQAVPTTTCASGFQGAARMQIGECTKCHTAHKAKSQALLWNHTLNAISYNWGNTSTTSGTNYPSFQGDTYTGPTPKCLSCHDGAMASTDGMWFNKQYNQGAIYGGGVFDPKSSHNVANGQTGSMVGTHPVAMPYPLNGGINTYNGTSTTSITASSGWVADPSATMNIMLYNDAQGYVIRGASGGRTGIECGSCHDVHNGPRVPDTSAVQSSPLLLTGWNTGNSKDPVNGYICNKCHNK